MKFTYAPLDNDRLVVVNQATDSKLTRRFRPSLRVKVRYFGYENTKLFVEMSLQPAGTFPTQMEQEAVSLHGSKQVKNHGMGYTWEVNDLVRLQRFLILGTEKGTYYVDEDTLKRDNVMCLDRLISENKGKEAVNLIKEISVNGRNFKQHSLLFALAICARCNDKATKQAAYAILSDVCRIPTHLFMFIKFCEQESDIGTGWGRAHRRAITQWYTNFKEDPQKLAYLVTKYKVRENWAHKDVVRLAHAHTHEDTNVGFILRYIAKSMTEAEDMYIRHYTADDALVHKLKKYLNICDEALHCNNVQQLCSLIKEHNLVREHVPPTMLKHKEVWETLLKKMPIEAMVRNLGKMTSLGLFPDNSENQEIVVNKLKRINTPREAGPEEAQEEDAEETAQAADTPKKKSFIHPFRILIAMMVYKQGHGDRGKLKWTPNQKIVDALDVAFYKAFEAIEPTRKTFCLAVDISGSMEVSVMGTPAITCSMAATAMMMATARTEENHHILAFSHRLEPLDIQPEDSLDTALRKMMHSGLRFGSTDCAQPMKWAIEKHNRDIDVFVVYTDSETYYGNIHPSEALRQYRTYANKPDAKLIVCGMASNGFSIADPEDKNMLDVVGFDAAAPRVMAEFSKGNI